jgi:hypothetical protein
MNETKYKVRITAKNLPFTHNDIFAGSGISLKDAVALSTVLNNTIGADQIALVEYDAIAGETDEQAKMKVISDVKTHGLEDFAVFRNNMLFLTKESLTEVAPQFIPATEFVAAPAHNVSEDQFAAIAAMHEIEKESERLAVTTKKNEFDDISFVTYDIVHESFPCPIASDLYLASAAITISEAIKNGDAINSPEVLEALAANKAYSKEVIDHVTQLRMLLKDNKQKTKDEIAEEAAIASLADIENMLSRMKNTTIKNW